MALPSIFSGLTCAVIVYFYARKQIPKEIKLPETSFMAVKVHKTGAIYGLICLVLCILFLSLASKIGLELWLITLIFGAAMFLKDLTLDIFYFRSPRSQDIPLTESNSFPQPLSMQLIKCV
jgi:uncharacterized membrane protein